MLLCHHQRLLLTSITTLFFGARMTALAYLGGFEAGDGYDNTYTVSVAPYILNNYNAGQYGTNNGGPGGSFTSITPNTGEWVKNDAGAVGGLRYLLGHALFGVHSHTGNVMLGMRNNNVNVQQDLSYTYSLDSRDFNGLAPSSVTRGTIAWSLWVCPDAPTAATNPATEAFYWNFKDTGGNQGMQVGWDTSNHLIYRTSAASAWTTVAPTYQLSDTSYSRLDFVLDLSNQLISLDYSADGTIENTAFSNIALGTQMNDFTKLDWTLTYGNAKSFYDDSVFIVTVPEPSGAMLVGISFAVFGILRRRR
jgi:hypothetical protein